MTSRRVPGRFPPPGTSTVADLIRQRRGARGLTPLDGTLLHVPPVAEGWNALLGAIRTKGNLPGDVRELMILRVAARNQAAFEWIHHEHVGRDHGLNTAQLRIVRDVASAKQPVSSGGVLNALQEAALAFADASTTQIKVSDEVVNGLTKELLPLAEGIEEKVQDLLVEAGAVVATYNMVSRFLVSMDVAGKSDQVVPWPADRKEHTIPLSDPSSSTPQSLHVVTLSASPSARTLLLVNSLLTNHTMWDPLIPHLLSAPFNLILFDQRGHGKSSTPSPPTSTMGSCASDIASILTHLDIPRIHAIVGVSQGGATALNFIRLHPDKADRAVVCDTQAVGPQANVQAWDDRIALANSSEDGMHKLARATAGRWFPAGSEFHPEGGVTSKVEFVTEMIEGTDKVGFEAGARALQGYDLVSPGEKEGGGESLWKSRVPTLLVAGEKDAGGKIAEGLKKAKTDWEREGGKVQYLEIKGCGHLPMIDGTEEFWKGVKDFLA